MWNVLNEKMGMKDGIVLVADFFKESLIIFVCVILSVVMGRHTVKII